VLAEVKSLLQRLSEQMQMLLLLVLVLILP
jgi:hypothetical protein